MSETKYPLHECAVFYDPEKASTLDAVHPETGKGVWGGRTLEETPGAILISFEAACERTNAHYRHGVSELTEEEWDRYSDQLPPEDYVSCGGELSFKCPERTAGDITVIYCTLRVGGIDRFFSMSDNYNLPHKEIVERCRKYLGRREGGQCEECGWISDPSDLDDRMASCDCEVSP